MDSCNILYLDQYDANLMESDEKFMVYVSVMTKYENGKSKIGNWKSKMRKTKQKKIIIPERDNKFLDTGRYPIFQSIFFTFQAHH